MGIYDRDWYAEHHGAKARKQAKRQPEAPSGQPEPTYLQARPRGRVRPTTWLDRNWWRLMWCAVFALLLAALVRSVLRLL